MNFRRTVPSLGLLVLLLAGTLVALRILRPADERIDAPLFPLNPEQIVRIDWTVFDADGQPLPTPMSLRREEDTWYMDAPFAGAACDSNAVAAMLDAAHALRVVSLPSGPGANAFTAVRRLTLSSADASVSCDFAATAPLTLSEVLARLPSGKTVLTDAATLGRLPVSASTLRTRTLLPVAPERILSLDWRTPGQPYFRVQQSAVGAWNVTLPFPIEVRRTEALRALRTLTAEGTVQSYVFPADDYPTALRPTVPPLSASAESRLMPYGLDEESALRISIRIRGYAAPITLRLGKAVPGSSGHIYALMNRFRAVVTVPESIRNIFESNGPFITDYRNIPIFSDADSATRLTLRTNTESEAVQLSRTDGRWRFTLPADLPADSVAVRKLLKNLSELTGDLVGTGAPDAPPFAILTAGRATGDDARICLYDSDDEGIIRVFRADTHRLFHVRRTPLSGILPDTDAALKLIDRTILSEAAGTIRRIAVDRRDGRSSILTRATQTDEWNIEYPAGSYGVPSVTESWLNAFAALSAERILCSSADSESLRKYGLETPELRLTLDLDGANGLRRILSVGPSNPVTGRAPAAVRGRPVIYELSADTLRLLRQIPFATAPLR